MSLLRVVGLQVVTRSLTVRHGDFHVSAVNECPVQCSLNHNTLFLRMTLSHVNHTTKQKRNVLVLPPAAALLLLNAVRPSADCVTRASLRRRRMSLADGSAEAARERPSQGAAVRRVEASLAALLVEGVVPRSHTQAGGPRRQRGGHGCGAPRLSAQQALLRRRHARAVSGRRPGHSLRLPVTRNALTGGGAGAVSRST